MASPEDSDFLSPYVGQNVAPGQCLAAQCEHCLVTGFVGICTLTFLESLSALHWGSPAEESQPQAPGVTHCFLPLSCFLLLKKKQKPP